MKFFTALAENDDASKLLFDSLRNTGICVAMLAAGSWRLSAARDGWYFWFDFACGSLVASIAVWLLVLNQLQLSRKLFGAGLSHAKVQLLSIVISLGASALIVSAIPRLLVTWRASNEIAHQTYPDGPAPPP